MNDKNSDYKVILKGDNNQQPVLGIYKKNGSRFTFTPIIPFNAGQSYEVIEDGNDYLEFTVEKELKQEREATKLLKIYPEVDTVPENLLKMYFTFSKPIQQSEQFLDFVTVFDQKTKEPLKIFLPLENELWNKDHTEITLWLDPGRIKQDLIPNKELGKPIINRKTYEIVLLNTLRDADGERINQEYRKIITVAERDGKKPTINDWELTIPAKNTKESIGISFGEALDANMLTETIQVFTIDNVLIDGNFLTSKKSNSTLFVPKELWKQGNYKVVIDSKQEDLAGNNFNRLFDTDLQAKKSLKPSATQEILFTVE